MEMEWEKHKYVYLPNNVIVDASPEAGLGYIKQLRIRSEGNKYFILVIREGKSRDPRLLRVAQLLGQLNGKEKALCDSSQRVFDIRAKDPRRYIGYDPAMIGHMKELRGFASLVDEFAKRVILYCDHLRINGSKLRDDTRVALESTMSVQRKMTLGLVWSTQRASRLGVTPGPGPLSLPYHPEGAPNPEEQETRGYIDGAPAPVMERNPVTGNLQPGNWRWDPDIRCPTPYNKFFRFEGPFFAPYKPFKYHHFYVPESAVKIRNYYINKYDQVENNFKATGRLPRLDEQQQKEFEKEQKEYGDHLALSSGENYDRFSIVHELDHCEPVENRWRPYVWVKPGTVERQVNFGDGTGRFKPEDLNRAMKQSYTGQYHSVPTVDNALFLVIDAKTQGAEASGEKASD
ncbi:hypothetical protein diail_8974 [Diaporthe ilicicola]|nr:hypothetical protein diail_8974 [Diaporthe ilicicola]